MRVVAGAVLDVAVDVRVGSPTFGAWVGVELSAENGRQLLIPEGFLHGFVTRAPDTEVLYKVSGYYEGAHDLGLAFDDPALGIRWPVDPARAIVSAKDRAGVRFRDAELFD